MFGQITLYKNSVTNLELSLGGAVLFLLLSSPWCLRAGSSAAGTLEHL